MFIYNALSCLMWIGVSISRDASVLKMAQLVGLADVLLAGVSATKVSPAIVAKHVALRIATLFLTDYSQNQLICAGLCISWGMVNGAKYFHQMNASDLTDALRTYAFHALYPVAACCELLCFYYQPKDQTVCVLFPVVLVLYVVEAPSLVNFMVIQRRKRAIVRCLQLHRCSDGNRSDGNRSEADCGLTICHDGKNYTTTFACESTVRRNLSRIIPNESLRLHPNSSDKSDKRAYVLRDVGMQVSWRGVFICEYMGPLIIPLAFYPRCSPTSVLWSAHYAKRIYESACTHSFSNAHMPVANLFKNSLYYWGASYYIARETDDNPPPFTAVSAGLCVVWLAAQIMNLKCHQYLAGLRTQPDSRAYELPTWGPFRYVACPNYTFEIIAWVAFTCLARSYASFGFTMVGAIQMSIWARKKHRRNRQLFGRAYGVKFLLFYWLL